MNGIIDERGTSRCTLAVCVCNASMLKLSIYLKNAMDVLLTWNLYKRTERLKSAVQKLKCIRAIYVYKYESRDHVKHSP